VTTFPSHFRFCSWRHASSSFSCPCCRLPPTALISHPCFPVLLTSGSDDQESRVYNWPLLLPTQSRPVTIRTAFRARPQSFLFVLSSTDPVLFPNSWATRFWRTSALLSHLLHYDHPPSFLSKNATVCPFHCPESPPSGPFLFCGPSNVVSVEVLFSHAFTIEASQLCSLIPPLSPVFTIFRCLLLPPLF